MSGLDRALIPGSWISKMSSQQRRLIFGHAFPTARERAAFRQQVADTWHFYELKPNMQFSVSSKNTTGESALTIKEAVIRHIGYDTSVVLGTSFWFKEASDAFWFELNYKDYILTRSIKETTNELE